MKLNLDTSNLLKKKESEKKIIEPEWNPYESPVSWWEVTTEGNYDGKEIFLGSYYGHVASIAFSLADKPFYSLQFTPFKTKTSKPNESPNYTAVKSGVWISLNVSSNTWNMSPDQRALWFEKWLDVTEPKIKVSGTYKGTTYFACSHLQLIDLPK